MLKEKIFELACLSENILEAAEKADAVCQAACETLGEDKPGLAGAANMPIAYRQCEVVSDYLFSLLEDVNSLNNAIKSLSELYHAIEDTESGAENG